MNTGPDILSRPLNVEKGQEDTQDMVALPPAKFIGQISISIPSETQKRDLMTLVHDHPTAGHPGRDETLRRAQNHLVWKGMKAWIANYVAGCAICQQNKNLTHRPRVPLYRITTPEDSLPFQQIAMDLITGLPKIKGKDAILTIIDHGCSQAALFLPCSTTITGLGIAALYLKNVYPWFGLPKKVITDRDPRFTSHFGRGLATKIGAQQNISTAFHPRTDGLSERKNQWIEQYLRIVTSMAPEDWTDWLSIATAVHNDRKNVTTGLSPNQILWGGEPQLLTNEGDEVKSQTVQERLVTMKERRLQAITAINQSSKGQAIPSSFVVGAQVWLEGTHLRLPYQATKLAPKRYGPFEIVREISPVAYQLRLPIAWNIHNVFHASLLSPYRETDAHGPNYSRPSPDLIEGEEEYEVERVINHRHAGRARTLPYLIKWKGDPEADNTWEPADQVHAPQLVKTYHQQHPLEDKRGRASTRSTIRTLLSTHQCLPTGQSIKATSCQCRPDLLLPSDPQGRNEHTSFGTPTPSSLTKRYKESWAPTARSSASWHKSKAAPSPLDQRETSPREKTCTRWCFTASSMPWLKPLGGQTADTQSRKGSLKKPLTTYKG